MEANQSKRFTWGAALLLAVIVTIIAIGVARLYTQSATGGKYAAHAAIELSASESIEIVGDGFVTYDGSVLERIGSSGKSQWIYSVGSDAEFDAGTYGVAAWSGRMLRFINWGDGTTMYSDTQNVDIVSAHLGSRYAAVVLAPETDGKVVIMEHGGKVVDSIALGRKVVLDYGFFSEGSLFWLMTLDTSGTVPTCSITTYQPGKRTVGAISDNEQMMYQVMFQSSQLCCVGVTHMKVYDYLGTEDTSKRKLVYGWYLVSRDQASEDPMMAFVQSSQYDISGSMQDVRMIRSSVDQTVRMPYQCVSLIAKGGNVYGFSPDGYVMVARTGRQKVDAYATGIPIDRVYGITGDNVAVIGYGTYVYLLQL